MAERRWRTETRLKYVFGTFCKGCLRTVQSHLRRDATSKPALSWSTWYTSPRTDWSTAFAPDRMGITARSALLPLELGSGAPRLMQPKEWPIGHSRVYRKKVQTILRHMR